MGYLLQGNLPDLGIEPGSPAWQVDSLPSEPPATCAFPQVQQGVGLPCAHGLDPVVTQGPVVTAADPQGQGSFPLSGALG